MRLTLPAVAALLVGAAPLQAQTGKQLAAWDALMLTPVGALTPTAHDPAPVAAGAQEIAVRYGRWKFDADDAIHDNVGFMWSRHLAFLHSTFSAVAGYAMIECHSCDGWVMGGADLRTELWHGDVAEIVDRPVTVGAGLRVAAGSAAYRGTGTGFASSLSAVVPLDASVPIGRSSRLLTSFVTGLGYGSLSGETTRSAAVLPIVGWSLAFFPGTHLGFNAGWQRVLLVNTPSQFGVALSWSFGTHGGLRP